MAQSKIANQDMFGDGQVVYDYIPHKQVIIRAFDFKIVVSKPYTLNVYNNKQITNTQARLDMSTNTTVHLEPNDFLIMHKAIMWAIEKLNSENDGVIITEFGTNYDNINNIPSIGLKAHAKKPDTIKGIPYKDISSYKVYEDERGHKWIYLGAKLLYRSNNGKFNVINRSNGYGKVCTHIYINYDNLYELGYTINNGIIILNTTSGSFGVIDSYASKKKLIKEITRIEADTSTIYANINNNISILYMARSSNEKIIQN